MKANAGFRLLSVWVLLLCAAPAWGQAPDSSWPRQVDTGGWTVTMYQPQIESFEADRLEARAAVAVKGPDTKDPLFGAVWMSCRVSTDYDERTVTLLDVAISGIKFPDMTEAQTGTLTAFLEAEIPTWNLEMELDRLIASLGEAEVQSGKADELNHKPPKIHFRKSPTVLIFIDGDPMLREIEGSSLQYVANTPYFLLFDTKARTYYLKGGAFWYSSSKVASEWKPITTVPDEVLKVAKQAEAKSAASQPQPDSGIPEIKEPPDVLVTTEPAELLLSDGEPDFASVEGTGLLYLKNSENDILMEIGTQQYYVLLAGRWYRSKSLEEGPWKHVPPDQVPKDFATIPVGSDMADVRPSVAGTQEAKDAVLEATIPQTAEVERTKTLTVKYDGETKFDPIEGTSMKYAVNTAQSVLLIKGTYYCCEDAVWYSAADPVGPWKVADSVPKDVEDIPASSPVYNVKYVYVYDSTPEVVYVGYTPAYTGVYYYGGCMVYGTGYWYHPPYPAYYYPHPVTYGFGVHYNPWTGWGMSFGVSYGWLHIGFSTGGYYGGYWGAAGYHNGYRHGYAHGYYHGRQQGFAAGYYAGQHTGQGTGNRNMYRDQAGTRPTQPSSRPSAGTRPSQQPSTRPSAGTRPAQQPSSRPSAGTSDRQGAGTKAGPSTTPATRTPKATGGANNVYTDKSGNVYKNEGGQWQQRDNSKGSWSPTGSATTKTSNQSPSRASSTTGRTSSQQDLNRSAQTRQHGSQRASSYQGSRGGGGGRGGGGRGGGGRR